MSAGRLWTRVRSLLLYTCYLLVFAVLGLSLGGGLLLQKLQERIGDELRITGGWFLLETPEVGVRVAPDVAVRYEEPPRRVDFHIYSDGEGLRVREKGARIQSPVDVLLVGGSFFFGWGVEAEDSVGEKLALLSGLRVANGAIPAVGVESSLRTVQRLRGLEPRVVIYGFIDDHLRRAVCPCAATISPFCQAVPYVAFDDDGRPVARDPVQSVFAPTNATRSTFEAVLRDGSVWATGYWGFRGALGLLYQRAALTCPEDPQARESAFLFSVGRLSKAVQEAGAALIVVYIPPLGYAGATPSLRLEALRNRPDLRLVDLRLAVMDHYMDPRRAGRSLVLERDFHPSAAAHDLFARELCRALESGGYVEPARCSGTQPG